jgi:hypothetical protein
LRDTVELTAMSSTFCGIDWQQAIDHVHANQLLLFGLVGTIVFAYFSAKLLLAQTIPNVSVPVPQQAQHGWTGPELERPSIQGKDPSLIQCYCPATAQLIDTIKAATADDVNAAIDKAKAAQLKWRTTTFTQRTLVMKTLLKFILENQGSVPLVCQLNSSRGNRPRLLSRFRGRNIESRRFADGRKL